MRAALKNNSRLRLLVREWWVQLAPSALRLWASGLGSMLCVLKQ